MYKGSPVYGVHYLVMQAFNSSNPGDPSHLSKAIQAGDLHPDLMIIESDGLPITPQITAIDGKAPQIQLHFVHLEFTWAFIYGLLVIQESLQQQLIDQKYDGHIDLTQPHVHRAAELFSWAISLRAHRSPWPEGLPSPVSYASSFEKNVAEKVNGIYSRAIAYLLWHETAHALLGHFQLLQDGKIPGDPAVTIDVERDADNFALRAMVPEGLSEKQLRVCAFPVVAAALSRFFLIRTPHGVAQRLHPDLHVRVANLLTLLPFSEQQSRDYFWFLAAMSLRLFMFDHDIDDAGSTSRRIFDTPEEMFEAEFEVLNSMLEQIKSP